MRKLILMFIMLFVSFSVVPQNTKTDTIIKKNEEVDQLIETIAQKNKESIEVIKSLSEDNKAKIQDIKEIELKQNRVLDRILSKRKKATKIAKPSTKILVKKVPETIFVVTTPDSSCVKFQRELFGKRKCIEWNYKK